MDAIYYITGFLTTFGLPGLLITTMVFLIKPHLINNHKRIKNPLSRKKIAAIGLTSFVVAFMGFGTVLATTEPASVKQARLAHEATEVKSLQLKKQEEQKHAAEVAKAKEAEALKPVVKTETKTETIAFESTEQNDSAIPLGERRISVNGADGERKITYEITYVKNKETGVKETKNEITKQPVNKVTLVGTYVKPAPVYVAPQPSCPNGTYVNSAGNTVCSPYSSSAAPAGATAQCSDGTYSFSQSRRGTCSHHGGVATWL
jgi:hypothetical protein